ncbi:MAG TPA: flagellar hook-length control protein FliK [Brevundimonas sp.]
MSPVTLTSVPVAPTAPSRAAKAADPASADAFGAMVADIMAEGGDEGVSAAKDVPAKTSPETAADQTTGKPADEDAAQIEASQDKASPQVLNAPLLLMVQPPAPTTDGPETAGAIETAPPAGVRPDGALLADAGSTSSAPIDASESFAPPVSASTTPASGADPAPPPTRSDPSTNARTAAATATTTTTTATATATATAAAAAAATPAAGVAGAAGAVSPQAKGSPVAAAPGYGAPASGPGLALKTDAQAEAGEDSEPLISTPRSSSQTSVNRAPTDHPAGLPSRTVGGADAQTTSAPNAAAQSPEKSNAATMDVSQAAPAPEDGSPDAPSLLASSSTGQLSGGQSAPPSSPTTGTSTFAAQVQAQSHSADAVLTATIDTAPTGQSQPAPQTSSISTMPVVASFSGLSRATLETTVQIAAQITRQLAGRSTRFEMGLTPEGLGKVNVSMDIDADGQLTARLAFDNPLAAADLRARVDELRGQLQDAGFKLADDALTFSHQDASSRDGGAAEQRRDQNQGRAFAAASRMADDADTTSPVPAWVSLSLTPRGVDMKV